MPEFVLLSFHLAFTHPSTGVALVFTAPPPVDTRRLLEALGSAYAEAVPEE